MLVFSLSLILMVDDRFNGFFADWFYDNFMLEYSYFTDSNTSVIKIVPNWSALKLALTYCFIVGVVVISVLIYIITHYGVKHQMTYKMAKLKSNLDILIHSNQVDCSIEFIEIESMVLQLKNDLMQHQRLLETETQRRSDLITYLAHDLKTPLASIIGYLSLLDEAKDFPLAQQQKYINITLMKSLRLEELINQFFDLTRFSLQKLVLNRSRFDLALLFEQLQDEFNPLLRQRTLTIDCPAPLYFYGDGDKLARVFNNILRNAIAYSEQDSLIELSCHLEEALIITLSNTGSTIPENELDRIFEKFYRLDAARASTTGQSGLGLAIAWDIVKAHQGTIKAFSDQNKTSFVITLPNEIRKT